MEKNLTTSGCDKKKKFKKSILRSTWSLLAGYFHFKIYSEKGSEAGVCYVVGLNSAGVPEAELSGPR